MAVLPETAGTSYPSPRQIEDGESQAGGPDGLWNAHARDMIERTNWLRNIAAALQNSAGYRDVLSISASQTLTAADMGECLVFAGTAAATLTLPAFSAVPNGAIEFINTGTANLTVLCAVSDQIDNGPSAVSSIVVPPNQSLKLIRATGSSLWHPVSVTAAGLATVFAALLANNGWQRLPSGLIIQWYRVSMAAGFGTQTFSHPITFPTAVFVAVNTQSSASQSSGAAVISSLTTSQITLQNNSTTTAANTTYVIAIGN